MAKKASSRSRSSNYNEATTNFSVHIATDLMEKFDKLLDQMDPRPSRSAMVVKLIKDHVRDSSKK